ncbi:CPBP family intramembrane glutamic endopeptidase [Williamwhitmania taraxaci]|uniref:CAAX protease self-immunity n=1 Tax=Williamwhitmania taraxaci TaxID=1640674 RepID=A0A1G6NDA2_9BACT|nr:type II CAAX endopeptidase family protein [Williamwhitmania taraxaci]SDC65306.1 CAAX protease self-immunity [Williamwhitmania taraxaci]
MTTNKSSFRDRTCLLFEKPLFILSAITLVVILTIFTGGLGFFFGITIALITFWAKRWDWHYFGLSKPSWTKSIISGILYAIGIFLLVDVLIQPILEHLFGEIDLQSFSGVKGNLISYVTLILFMWIIAGFGEEFLFRGYIVKRLAIIFGDTNYSWLMSATITAIIFGLAHIYQGTSGVITTGIIGFIMGMIFLRHRQNLSIAMFTHGFYDMIGITLLYLGEERSITEFISKLILE